MSQCRGTQMEPGPVQDTRKLCSRRYGLPGEPALHLPPLTPADVCTSRPSLPHEGHSFCPLPWDEDPAWHAAPAAVCLVYFAVFTPATLNHALFPHTDVPAARAVPSASPVPSAWASLLYVFAQFLPAFQNPAQMSPLWHLL